MVIATRAMSEAQYFSTGEVPQDGWGIGHYGLALEHYTHFTSPIRRYADILVHRQLMQAVLSSGCPQSRTALMSHAELSVTAESINQRHRASKRAQQDCSELYLALLLKKQPRVERAIVISLRPNGVGAGLAPMSQVRKGLALMSQVKSASADVSVCRWANELGAGGVKGQVDGQDTIQAGVASVGEKEQSGCVQLLRLTGAGEPLVEFHLLQSVWVQLSAGSTSRARSPRICVDLLHPSDEMVVAALSRPGVASESVSEAPSPCRRQELASAHTTPAGSSTGEGGKGGTTNVDEKSTDEAAGSRPRQPKGTRSLYTDQLMEHSSWR
ncbi:hypothetical protein CYMTET_31628 [Cymbomonas tetramitiformis]|uniref:DIS3-like exonuclease 1 n=1 Tax=Cymbomonas tetramitiformis TaxID=36881 RepID=A0AAE0FGF1_9CHLO|nr:hypothetical protein CYMTET_31628 [Cymbomonas tetramitiformis]